MAKAAIIMPKKPRKFWMIVREPGGNYTEAPNPRHVYVSLDKARSDAGELARQQGKRFYVLQTVEALVPTAPPVELETID